ncbi:hypothetical protein PABY_24130 [Pyrodictium abyssi]|uniref:Uncharacterized protein n=2 Tax=Pyrodictium abyssi TaxID=54256 RepID=A0ABM8J079_9CREN|nr:hypothetical protein PABY_24130 [Pyrodictium abyssi]
MRGIRRTADLYSRIGEGIATRINQLKSLLKGIRGVRLLGAEVEIRWRGRDSISLAGLLEELNKRGERIVLVLDEAQLIRPPVSTEIKQAIAYTYDNLENVTVILSGSEIGLLRDFTGTENPESPPLRPLRPRTHPRTVPPEPLRRIPREGLPGTRNQPG